MEQSAAPGIGGVDVEALPTVRSANVEDTPSDGACPENADRSVRVWTPGKLKKITSPAPTGDPLAEVSGVVSPD